MSSLAEDQKNNHQEATKAELSTCLQAQRKAYHANPNPGLEQRKKDLLALKTMLGENREAIIEAISKDYGNRSRHETMLAEIIMVLDGFNFGNFSITPCTQVAIEALPRMKSDK